MNKKNIAIICSIIVIIISVIIVFILINNRKYEVRFESNGGSFIKTQTIKKSDTATKPEDPTKTGYEFDNWYLDNEIFDFTTPITKDITLVAKWVKNIDETIEGGNFTIKFDSNGGSDVSSVKVGKNNLIKKPTDPTRNGYEFVSWQLNGKDFDFNTKITKDITLVAKWKKVSSASDGSVGNADEITDNKPTIVEVTSVNISETALSLNVGDKSRLSAVVNPNNATNKTIVWSSSNTSVATIDNDGNVIAVGTGTTTITARAGSKTATCTITVIKPITYSVQWEKVENSSIGQYMLYIRSSEGKNVSGVVTITTTAGTSSDVEITSAGKMYIKSAVQNAIIKSVN